MLGFPGPLSFLCAGSCFLPSPPLSRALSPLSWAFDVLRFQGAHLHHAVGHKVGVMGKGTIQSVLPEGNVQHLAVS